MASSAAGSGEIKILGGVPAKPAKRLGAIEGGMRRLEEQLKRIRQDSDRSRRRRPSDDSK